MQKSTVQEIKEKVRIEDYFYEIIVPQLSDYYSDYPVDFSISPVVKCPLHDENTPSMRMYEDTNTCHCFGCKGGGDIISLHINFTERISGNKPSFNDAVTFLDNYFLKGNRATGLVRDKVIDKEEYKSSVVEVAKLSNYLSNLEKQLLVDDKISHKSKVQLWSLMDEIDLLVSKNFVNADSALKYIKDSVRKIVN